MQNVKSEIHKNDPRVKYTNFVYIIIILYRLILLVVYHILC